MKRGRFSEEQILGILKDHEAGRKFAELAKVGFDSDIPELRGNKTKPVTFKSCHYRYECAFGINAPDARPECDRVA